MVDVEWGEWIRKRMNPKTDKWNASSETEWKNLRGWQPESNGSVRKLRPLIHKIGVPWRRKINNRRKFAMHRIQTIRPSLFTQRLDLKIQCSKNELQSPRPNLLISRRIANIATFNTIIQLPELTESATEHNIDIGLMSSVFANGPGDWGSIPDRVKNCTLCRLAKHSAQ